MNVPEDPLFDLTADTEVSGLIQTALRESYLETTQDLRAYAHKVRHFNGCRKVLRAYLTALRQLKAGVMAAARERGIDHRRGDEKDRRILAELFEEHRHSYDAGELEYELGIPDCVPLGGVDDFQSLDEEIGRFEEQLNTTGEDAQLANFDLQNALQKQQQTLQLLSTTSKTLHDVAMAVIRKIGG